MAWRSIPDGRRVVSSSWDYSLRVWDLGSGQALRTLQGHTDWVTGVALTRDGRRIVSGSRDNTLRAWKAVRRCARSKAIRLSCTFDSMTKHHFALARYSRNTSTSSESISTSPMESSLFGWPANSNLSFRYPSRTDRRRALARK
jgi:WD40 repeat protein